MRSRAAVLIASLAVFVGACSDDGDAYFGTTKRIGKANDAFYVNAGGEPEYLDPGKLNDTLSGALALQLFEGLTKYDPRDNHPTQGVATHWEQSDDNRLYRFHLRPDARWSDGKPVTAHDFEYAWKRVLRPAIASRSAPNLYPLKNGELFNRGRLKVMARDANVLAEPRGDANVADKLKKGAAVRILGQSPLTIDSGIVPVAELPATTSVTRRKPDAKTGAPEKLGLGGGAMLSATESAWKGSVVQVVRAGPPVDCDGEPDRFYLVARGTEQGWIPGCLTKPAKGEKAYVLVAPHTSLPTYRVTPAQEPVKEAPPIGFVAADDVTEDDVVVGVHAVDDLTLDVELEQPTPYFTDLACNTTLNPLREDIVEPFEKRGEPDLWVRPGSIVSNGPYMIDDWKFRYEITMKANPYYWNRDKLKIHRIVWVEVEEYHATLNLYKAGEIDYIGDNVALPAEYMPLLEKKKDFSRTDYLSVYWYELNTKKPPLNDVRVRRALNQAIDKRQIIDKVARGGQTPATHYVPDFTGLGYADEVASERAAGTDPFVGPEFAFDPVHARELLKEAGYEVVPDGEGFRATNMPPIEILYNTSEGHKNIAVAVQDMWRKNLGISATLRNEEWNVMLKNYRDGNFQVMRFGQVADYNHPNTFLESFEAGHPQNQTGWSDPEFDRTMHRAAREADTKKSIRLYRDAEKIVASQMPRIPFYFYTKSTVIKPFVRGFYGSTRNLHLVEYLFNDPDWEKGAPNSLAFEPLECPKPGRIGSALDASTDVAAP